jgi:hypothetical protein
MIASQAGWQIVDYGCFGKDRGVYISVGVETFLSMLLH